MKRRKVVRRIGAVAGMWICLGLTIVAGWAQTADDPLATWSVRRPLPPASELAVLHHTGEEFMAVGSAGQFLASKDGWNWRTLEVSLPRVIHSMTQGPEGYVAVGPGGAVLHSTNLVAWAQATSVTSADLHAVAYGAGRYCAVGVDGLVLTSIDGREWYLAHMPEMETLRAVVWAADRFIAVGNGGMAAVSSDGTGWEAQDTGIGRDLLALAWGRDRVVAVGADGWSARSNDGTQWTPRHTGFHVRLESIPFGDGKWIAVGDAGTVLISEDGHAWEERSPVTDAGLRAITHGEGQFVAAGEQGVIVTSTDGIEWIPTRSALNHRFHGAAFGNTRFVLVGGEISAGQRKPLVLTRPAVGQEWLRAELPASGWLYGVTWSSVGFVAVGEAGLIAGSTDGVTWTSRNSGTAKELLGVASGEGRFIAVGGNFFDRTPAGWLLSSEDGVSWTTVTPAAVRSALGSITYAADRFVAVGGGLRGLGHFNVSFTTIVGSADGVSWTDYSPLSVDAWLMGVAYHHRHFVAVGLSGTVLQSREVPEVGP